MSLAATIINLFVLLAEALLPVRHSRQPRCIPASAESVVYSGKADAASQRGSASVKTMKYTYWQDGAYYLGFWNDYPDYHTQGMSKEELTSNLRDLLADMQSGELPYIRKVEELAIAE